MSTYERAREIVVMLTDGGVKATADPARAGAPCVLVTPPVQTFDLACGRTLTWTLYALVPGPATADAWGKLDELADAVSGVLNVVTMEPTSYVLSAGSDPLVAYRIVLDSDPL